ncbi:GDSL esterase/lipase 1-like isoform X4 [Camellia sinensis]|uniref:GDSL esterase/lipase 1-like isoform X4 n=1 Tax=Camellia sinensis TaxID=4442 RepID=UPI00103636CA|nr:GDSL esterase/lipase 1-like isoform X4 [Camellia sinensis]
MVKIASSSMAKLSIHELCVLIIITSFASIVISTTTESVKPTKKSALFVFGDSLFDPGNNQYINGSKPGASSYYPYGQTFFNHPTGRLSDGRIVPDFIALFAKLPMLTPYLQPGGEHDFTAGTNFASAGACALDAPHPQMAAEIYEMGGRKIAFQNAGPLGCTPGKRFEHLGSCDQLAMSLATLHNTLLAQSLKNLESHLPGFQYSIFDYYNALYDRIANPSKYGFEEGKSACCGSGQYRACNCGVNNGTIKYELCSNPSKYVWFDSAHTTEETNFQLANLIWSGHGNVTGPYNVKQLFGFSEYLSTL